MKTTNIIIAGVIAFGIGFLFWKNKKKPTTETAVTTPEEEPMSSGGGGGGGYMGGIMPIVETPSATNTGTSIVSPDPLANITPQSNTSSDVTTGGTSIVSPDPLAEADAKAKAKAEADAKLLAEQEYIRAMEAKSLASKQQAEAQAKIDAEIKAKAEALQASNLAQAKIISNTIQININKRNGYKKASSVRNIQTVIDADIAKLRALGYIALPNGGVQPI